MVIRFYIPTTTANDLQGFSIPDFIHYIFFPILILQKEPVMLSLIMLSAKQGYYWYHFFYVVVMTLSLTGD